MLDVSEGGRGYELLHIQIGWRLNLKIKDDFTVMLLLLCFVGYPVFILTKIMLKTSWKGGEIHS